MGQLQACCAENQTSELFDSPLAKTIYATQEAAVKHAWIYLAVRPSIARWQYLRIHVETMHSEVISVSQFLQFKESLVVGHHQANGWQLEFDIGPFSRDFPKLRESRSIGRGVEFLNRRLSSQLFDEVGKGGQGLLEFLRVHQYQGMQLMVNSAHQGRGAPAPQPALGRVLSGLAAPRRALGRRRPYPADHGLRARLGQGRGPHARDPQSAHGHPRGAGRR